MSERERERVCVCARALRNNVRTRVQRKFCSWGRGGESNNNNNTKRTTKKNSNNNTTTYTTTTYTTTTYTTRLRVASVTRTMGRQPVRFFRLGGEVKMMHVRKRERGCGGLWVREGEREDERASVRVSE
jgi:hypothetical protein